MRLAHYSLKAVLKRWKNSRKNKKFGRPHPIQMAHLAHNNSKGDSYFKGKSFLLLTHELSYTGAPLLLMETAQMLIEEGATVKLVNPYRGRKRWSLRRNRFAVAREHSVPLVPFSSILRHLATSDFIIANTVTETVMAIVDEIIQQAPETAAKLIIWVHEIDVERYLPYTANIKCAALTVFDSQACKDAWENCIGSVQNSVVIHPSISPRMLVKLSQCRPEFPHVPTSRNPTNTHPASREEIRSVLGVDDSDFLVLCLGTVEDRKGQALLLDTLSQFSSHCDRPIKLCLVGFKNARKRKQFIKNMSDSERKVLSSERAYVWQSEIAAFYLGADAFVMNSQGENKGRGECFGRVTLEAMAAGRIVLGTSVGGTKEIIKHENSGYLFPPGVEGQTILTDQIKYLTKNPEVAAALGSAARKYALEVFDQSRFLKEFEVSLSKILQNHRNLG